VLFLTFSRTAVGQIARRAPGVFGGAGERIEIATFHAFAWRLVRAFGRYAGYGAIPPALESESRAKLLGRDRSRISYDDLVPAARRVLQSRRLSTLVHDRWPLIICDEFQDTTDEQWALLTLLGTGGRLLLLADPNQMIYTFLKDAGVGPERLDEARRLADREIYLQARSYRDPSGAIPAMAEAVRRRRFSDKAVGHAVRTGRLTVAPDVDEAALTEVVAAEVMRVQAAGAKSVGIFGHSNQGIAELGAALIAAGIDHVLVGIPEAHGEALIALATLCAFAAGTTTWDQARTQLATFLTACTRGKNPPELAVRLATGRALPRLFVPRLATLERELSELRGGLLSDVLAVATTAWGQLGITRGLRPWQRASTEFMGLARRHLGLPLTDVSVSELLAAATRGHARSLVDFD
jgi:DNA helicase-2/ATP-dependent DNA helicase PcrA